MRGNYREVKGALTIRQRGKSKAAAGKLVGGVGMGLSAPPGPLTNLVYYAAVSKGTMIVAEHRSDNIDLARVATKCLEKVPAFHRRFTFTTNKKMFCCLIEGPITYCAIVDEALTKHKAFRFLEHVRDEFKLMVHVQGMKQDGEGLEPYCLADEFSTVFRHLVAPLVGVPQKEVDRMEEEELLAQHNGEYDYDDTYIETVPPEVSTSDLIANHNHKQVNQCEQSAPAKNSERTFRFSPLKGKGGKADKKKVKDQVTKVKEIMMENSGKALDKGQKLEVMVEAGSTPESGHHLQKSASARLHAHRMWWSNVKLVLILDAVVCAILFAIWLGICKGFQCVK